VTRNAKKLPRIHSKIVARRSKMGPVKKKFPLRPKLVTVVVGGKKRKSVEACGAIPTDENGRE